jgi:GMP synthase-like glutamine amidotransferase
MKIHVLQHVPFEGIGSMASWLAERGAAISSTRFFENPALPGPQGFDLVIAMGGPMSVNDEATLPWLRPEKEFLRQAVAHGVPVIGVCLGAQLIASALGARVFRNADKEIGWFPIRATAGGEDTFRFPQECTVFHWHGETFDLPDGAIRLAQSAACLNQAFQFKRHVIGLQFHLETTPESARSLVEQCGDELVPGAYIQTAAQLLQAPGNTYAEINRLMGEVLAYVLR